MGASGSRVGAAVPVLVLLASVPVTWSFSGSISASSSGVRDAVAAQPGTGTLVLLRHGESAWNLSGRFSGWVDIDLTPLGEAQARRAGRLLSACGLDRIQEAHTSFLRRASRTLSLCLTEAGMSESPPNLASSWCLNERHYGALTGLCKKQAKAALGDDAFRTYRRGFSTSPPPMEPDHPFWQGDKPCYAAVREELPHGESMEECYQRVLPYLREKVFPSIRSGKTVMIAAHNNVLRCIIKDIDDIPVESIRDIEVPKAVPIVYHLDTATLQSVSPKSPSGMSCTSLGLEMQTTCPETQRSIPDLREEKEFQFVPFTSVFTRQFLQTEAKRVGIEPCSFPAYGTGSREPVPSTVGKCSKHHLQQQQQVGDAGTKAGPQNIRTPANLLAADIGSAKSPLPMATCFPR